MKKTLALAITLLWTLGVTQPTWAGTSDSQLDISGVERILQTLVPEVKNIKVVTDKDLEPNPQGKYRRHAFIQGDFNRDGQEDIAICATDEWIRQGASLTRNSYVLIASKRKDWSWVRVFLQKIDRLSSPFLIWDKKRMRLLVGANQSDYEPGDIVWDSHEKKYKFIAPIN